ncbi:hypothetical protein D3H55_20470 [Bacillus salacetis]|uniref:Uncharacterized protein n=1 Tax=Bacillus salacetis TaxID=2315464 RepID=A0A3A1QUZ4_9BACI|nr:hypothetical protein [Bacillus salacetis]RIW28942.1 hypothetical protein D3H55_20470 [Bacillus salacetis]
MILGMSSGIASLALWLLFSFHNPYSTVTDIGPMFITFFMLCLPGALAIAASIKRKPKWLFLSFIWSLPLSLYLVLTPGVFALFGVTSIMYLMGFILMGNKKGMRKNHIG